MKMIVSCLAGLLVVLACTATARAQQPCYPGYAAGPQFPGAYAPGFTGYNGYGAGFAPSYGPNPPFPPFNGMLPPAPWQQSNRFPSHPYVRGPRDYFMIDVR
jgi:hypothetical protein